MSCQPHHFDRFDAQCVNLRNARLVCAQRRVIQASGVRLISPPLPFSASFDWPTRFESGKSPAPSPAAATRAP